MAIYTERELGPSGYTVYKQVPTAMHDYQYSIPRKTTRSNAIDSSYSAFSLRSKLPPLPTSNATSLKLNANSPPMRKWSTKSSPESYRSRHPSSSTNYEPSYSRRPSIAGSSSDNANLPPIRPYSTAYYEIGLRSARASPIRDMTSIYSGGSNLSRRNSLSRLPRPEPSPMRELPPTPPRQKIRHYPLPPPSYTEGMIALSRRMRNRSSSPAPNYSEMELSTRPAIISAALGRPTPSKEMIRMTMCGPPLRQLHLGRNI